MYIPNFKNSEDGQFYAEWFANRLKNYSSAMNHVKNEFHGSNYKWEHIDGTTFQVIKEITDFTIDSTNQVYEAYQKTLKKKKLEKEQLENQNELEE